MTSYYQLQNPSSYLSNLVLSRSVSTRISRPDHPQTYVPWNAEQFKKTIQPAFHLEDDGTESALGFQCGLFSRWAYALLHVAYYVFHYRKDKWFIQTLFIWKLVVTNHASPLTLFPLARNAIDIHAGAVFTEVKYYVTSYCACELLSIIEHAGLDLQLLYGHRLALCVTSSAIATSSWSDCLLRILSPVIANPLYRIPLIGISSCGSVDRTISSSLTDVIITVTLVITLRGKRTGFVRTETFITKLIVFVSNRGVLTTILQIAQFITVASSVATHAELSIRLNARASVRTAVFGSTSNALPVQDIPLVTIDETSKNTASYSYVTQPAENQ
ncbi:predicted protein [Postia placenta Mad-698-R]|nr:predicted protein [Postia placenta Mad-698-R]